MSNEELIRAAHTNPLTYLTDTEAMLDMKKLRAYRLGRVRAAGSWFILYKKILYLNMIEGVAMSIDRQKAPVAAKEDGSSPSCVR
jgi:hypothetical protein